MSGWPQAGQGYGGPPPVAAKPPPSAAWYWVGAVILVGSIVGGVVLIVTGFAGAFTRPIDASGDGATITATEADATFAIYEEGFGGTFGIGNPPPCSVAGPGGEPEVRASLGATTLSLGSTTYHDVGRFTVPSPGSYTVRCDAPLAVGPSLEIAGTVARTFLGIGLIILGFIVGLIILIVTGVTRGSRKRQAAQAAGGWPAQGGPGQPWPGQAPGGWTG